MKSLNRCGVAAAEHCNLSCTACNHLSPIFKASFIDLSSFARTTSLLAKHLAFNTLVLQGGEPLLHPEIDELVRIARTSGLCRQVSILTNGTLLHKMSDFFWKAVDLVELSVYPGVKVEPIPPDRAKKVKVSDLKTFTESFSTIRNDDPALVRTIKDACHLYNRCFAIAGDHFYKCIISAFIPMQVKHEVLIPETVDGLAVNKRPTLGEELARFIDGGEPLKSCEFCCGTSGRLFPHTQTRRSEWLVRHDQTIQKMIDPARLRY